MDDAPLAVRRTRRSNMGVVKVEEPETTGVVPKTPSRRKRAVRFSDPGVSTCGLTPMMRRTSVQTPPSRRSSTPYSYPNTPSSSSRHFSAPDYTAPIRQTIDGRVQRRLRRNGMRDMMNKMDHEKKRLIQVSRAEIQRLKSEVKTRDQEIHELQNATVVMDTERIWDLEHQVEQLQRELDSREREQPADDTVYNWTMAARDPFADDYMDLTADDDDHFGDGTVAQLQASTPSRARSSFPTPPATSPTMPSTPCSRVCFPTPRSHAGVQVTIADPEKQRLEDELASLQLEFSKLTDTLDSYKALHTRVAERLPAATGQTTTDSAASLDEFEKRITGLMQAASDRSAALTALSASIVDIGFSGNDASDMIASITSGFRAARLELEYLTPGEITLPLTSHGAEVLDLLLTRLRDLAKKSKEDDDHIDEYHEIEQSLRKQLDSKVTVMNELRTSLAKAEKLVEQKTSLVQELEVSNNRFKGAVSSYVRDISELERLIERMEKSAAAEKTERDTDRQTLADQAAGIQELEAKIQEAVKQTEQLLEDMSEQQTAHSNRVVALNKLHGKALALRDARVMDLRVEIDRVNESMRSAHDTIRSLRVENGGLKKQMDIDKSKAKKAMDAMKEELQRVLQMSQEYIDSPKRAADIKTTGEPVVVPCRLKKTERPKKRPDSGLGLLEEDDDTF